MALEPRVGADEDPDKTDTLPALSGAAKREESAPATKMLSASAEAGFARGGRLDLPKLAAKMRSVEERVARQAADYAALAHKLERSQESETAAVARANALADELTAVRAAFETERTRNRESERQLFQKVAGSELARARREEGPRETTHLKEALAAVTAESQALKDALAARDATIVQVLNSLVERDAQLTALQREHARVVPDLEARVQAGEHLTAQLEAAETRAGALQLDLDRRDATILMLTARVARGESEVADGIRELKALRARSAAYLEVLQSREWRRGYEQSRWREPDAAPQALRTALVGLESQRDELKRKLAAVAAVPGQPTSASDGPDALDRAAAQRRIDEQAAQIAALKADVATAQEEVTVLLAHLRAAVRQEAPAKADDGQVAERERLADELAARTARILALEQENRDLEAALQRTRGALDEREFLIRRLERSESSNASALGRLQNTIERLGAVAAVDASLPELNAPAPVQPPEPTVDAAPGKLVRIDGGHAVTYVLQRRNQVGRTPGTEVHIDSSTVSRLHALIVSAPGGAIIEDNKSTNGTYVNGRRVTRQLLRDGDLLTIGEAQFRFVAEIRGLSPAAPAATDEAAET
jgi:chromosome segregation ATPase